MIRKKTCVLSFDFRKTAKSTRSNSRFDFPNNKKILKSTRSNSRFELLINKNRYFNSKRSQEEMVGFALIIILVSVIALVFLVISLRKPAEAANSREIENFLHASMLLTTSCKSNIAFYDFRDLIGTCIRDELCENGDKGCEILNKTSYEIIEKSFPVGEEARYKAYSFKISSENKTIIEIKKGNTTETKTAAAIIIRASGEDAKIGLSLYS